MVRCTACCNCTPGQTFIRTTVLECPPCFGFIFSLCPCESHCRFLFHFFSLFVLHLVVVSAVVRTSCLPNSHTFSQLATSPSPPRSSQTHPDIRSDRHLLHTHSNVYIVYNHRRLRARLHHHVGHGRHEVLNALGGRAAVTTCPEAGADSRLCAERTIHPTAISEKGQPAVTT